MMKNIINKLFLIKEIKSRSGIIHFRRWRLLSTPWFAIYIHGIYKADEDEHYHDHPWDYISIGLKGYGFEEHYKGGHVDHNLIKPFGVIRRKAEEFHKIESLFKSPIYTLFITGKRRREWGYSYNGSWLDHKTYRKLKSRGQLNG